MDKGKAHRGCIGNHLVPDDLGVSVEHERSGTLSHRPVGQRPYHSPLEPRRFLPTPVVGLVVAADIGVEDLAKPFRILPDHQVVVVGDLHRLRQTIGVESFGDDELLAVDERQTAGDPRPVIRLHPGDDHGLQLGNRGEVDRALDRGAGREVESLGQRRHHERR